MTFRSAAITTLTVGLAATGVAGAQESPLQQPFRVGETLVYHARIGSIASGSGEMRVVGVEPVRGRDTYLLRFDFQGRVGPVRMRGSSASWLDPETMTAMRFHKEERSPLGTSTERVELYPAQGIWRNEDGREGSMPTRLPLDELSFLYYIRTLPLTNGATYGSERHFDRARNPVVVRVIGRETIRVPAGEFATVVVEMVVPQGQHVSEGSTIRLHLTDDTWRIPVRIESSVRILGRVVFQLESSNPRPAPVVAAAGS
jgi:hypothetical protein